MPKESIAGHRRNTHFLPTTQVIPVARQLIDECLGRAEPPVLLLVSGGSAIGAYLGITELIEHGRLKNLRLGLIDERYGMAGHEHSNARAIEEQARLFSAAKAHGIEVKPVLTGQSVEQEVGEYQDWLEKTLAICRTAIGILGVGIDGHIAGIKPMATEELFDRMFQNDTSLVTHYHSSDFDQRITVTMTLLRRLNTVIVVAPGQGKRDVIEQAFETPEGGLYEMPARILAQLRDVEVLAAE